MVMCRSGYWSILAAHSLQVLGYTNGVSLQTGVRGWKAYEQPLEDKDGSSVDLDLAEEDFRVRLRPDQMRPKDWKPV